MSDDSLLRSQRFLGITQEELEKARSLVESQKAEVEKEIPILSLPPESEKPASIDFGELRTTGQIAKQFNQSLDKVTDVLLLLVLKFGRASSLLVGVLIGIVICVLALGWNTLYLAATRADVAELVDGMREAQKKQEEILKKTEEAYASAMAAKSLAEEVAKTAPAVVVGKDGKATLVIKGDKENPLPEHLPAGTPPQKASAPKRTAKGVEIPLNF